MPLVTIVMPAYNVENYIMRSIESVFKQTEHDWELIIINDGSTDKTLEVIKDLPVRDKRVSIINQVNLGVSAARNKGLHLAKGQYISFLDADDIYDPEYIKFMVKPLRLQEADVSFCKYREIDGALVISESPHDINTLVKDSFIQHLLSVRNTHANMAMMYSLSHLREHNITFLEGCSNGEDRMFVLRAAYVSKIVFIAEYLYYYVFREDSACRMEVSYEKFFAKLDGYLELATNLKNSAENPEQSFYLDYINREILCIQNNLRRKFWADLKARNFQIVSAMLEEYKNRYNQPFNAPQKGFKRFLNYFKIKIIVSNNPIIWKLCFII